MAIILPPVPILTISASNAMRLPKGQNADRPVQNGAAASYKVSSVITARPV